MRYSASSRYQLTHQHPRLAALARPSRWRKFRRSGRAPGVTRLGDCNPRIVFRQLADYTPREKCVPMYGVSCRRIVSRCFANPTQSKFPSRYRYRTHPVTSKTFASPDDILERTAACSANATFLPTSLLSLTDRGDRRYYRSSSAPGGK